MNNKLKVLIVTVAMTLSIPYFNSVANAATVLQYSNVKSNPYHAISGYLYKNATLRIKSHNADNYPRTIFYTKKAATVKRGNGNKAVYYYVINRNGKVKGWIWRGHLLRQASVPVTKVNKIISLIEDLTNKKLDKIIKILEFFDHDYSSNAYTTLLNNVWSVRDSNSTNSSDEKNLSELYNTLKNNQSIVTKYIDNILKQLLNDRTRPIF